MLYELIAVVRPGNVSSIRDICSSIGTQILQSRGVIRGIANWGRFDLPRPTTVHQNQNFQGHYFIMQFDSSIATQNTIKRQLSLDPRMVRFSFLKIGDKLGGKSNSIEKVDGDIPWRQYKSDMKSGPEFLSAFAAGRFGGR